MAKTKGFYYSYDSARIKALCESFSERKAGMALSGQPILQESHQGPAAAHLAGFP